MHHYVLIHQEVREIGRLCSLNFDEVPYSLLFKTSSELSEWTLLRSSCSLKDPKLVRFGLAFLDL